MFKSRAELQPHERKILKIAIALAVLVGIIAATDIESYWIHLLVFIGGLSILILQTLIRNRILKYLIFFTLLISVLCAQMLATALLPIADGGLSFGFLVFTVIIPALIEICGAINAEALLRSVKMWGQVIIPSFIGFLAFIGGTIFLHYFKSLAIGILIWLVLAISAAMVTRRRYRERINKASLFLMVISFSLAFYLIFVFL